MIGTVRLGACAAAIAARCKDLGLEGVTIAVATGARPMTTMIHQLRRTGGRYGPQVMCEGCGTANATIIERSL